MPEQQFLPFSPHGRRHRSSSSSTRQHFARAMRRYRSELLLGNCGRFIPSDFCSVSSRHNKCLSRKPERLSVMFRGRLTSRAPGVGHHDANRCSLRIFTQHHFSMGDRTAASYSANFTFTSWRLPAPLGVFRCLPMPGNGAIEFSIFIMA